MSRIDITSSAAPLSDGILQTANPLDATLQVVTDNVGTNSTLLLSTDTTQINSTLHIHTNNAELLDIEDSGSNNRFNINRSVQQINLDFASKPTDITTQVGAIRTYIDGTNLADVIKFQENGQVTLTERVKIESDSTVTTQTSSVIQATTTNANLVLAPNGTGAIVASIPDGTATGGNSRGTNAVDLQISRTLNTQVAGGQSSVISGGANNRISSGYSFSTIGGGSGNVINSFHTFLSGLNNSSLGDFSVAIGNTNASNGYASVAFGSGNTSSGSRSTISGGDTNTASSNYSTISGGQSNTASTGTHATVVGGQSNTASGQYAVAGGKSNTATALGTTAFGDSNNVTVRWGFAVGRSNNNNGGDGAAAIGYLNTINATGLSSIALGEGHTINSPYSVGLGADILTYLYGQITNGSSYFSAVGDAQQSLLTARRSAALTTGGTTVLSLDGTGATNLIIPNGNNRAWNVQVNWVAVVTAITGTATGISVGDVVTSVDLLGFKRVGGTSSASVHTSAATKTMVTTPAQYAACAIAYSAGASQEMAMTFTGPTFVGGGSVTMRVVARVELSEVAW